MGDLAHLNAGDTCDPSKTPDECGSGKTCSGAKNEGAAKDTKSCKADLATLNAGDTCDPTKTPDECGTGKTCSGDHNEGAAKDTKSCKATVVSSGTSGLAQLNAGD